MHKGPVTVIATEYGTRLDNQPVSRSATVDGVPDFVNLYDYDDQDRLVALSQTGQGAAAVADKLVTFDYNENDQFVTITRYASLDGSQLVAVSDYTYDQYGRPTALLHHQPPSEQPATQRIVPTADRQLPTAHGQLPTADRQRPTDHGQQPTDNALAAYTWTWEGGGDMVEVVPVGTASGPQFGKGWMLPFGGTVHTSRELEITPLPAYVWTFDTPFIGHLVQTTSTDGTVDYQYDPRGQLHSADYDYQPGELYTYDANGNRTNPGYITGDHNRLLSDGTYDYEYDAEGNRTRRTEIATGEVTEYHWDHRNRLVQVRTRTSDQGPVTSDTQYAYDYLNRWIARSHDPDGDGPLGFTDTFFVYDGTPPSGSLLDRAAVTIENIGQIVLRFEADAQGDPQLAHRYLWGPAVDQILADEQVTDPTAPGNVVWPLTDHLNTVRDLAIYDADTDTTTIVNHLIYDAYGRITSQSDPDHTSLFAFTARPFDPATGLQNNLNRWYEADVGRWLTEDPIGFEAGDANLYRYVHNAPTKWADPTGLFAGDDWEGFAQRSPPAAVKPLLDITQGTWRRFGINFHRAADTIELKESGVIVLLWGHGDDIRLVHQFSFTDKYQAAAFVGCDAGAVNREIPKQHQLPRSKMNDGKIFRGGRSLLRYDDPNHCEYWDRLAIEDAQQRAREWFEDPDGPREVKFIFVQAERGYENARIHTLRPDNLYDEIKPVGWNTRIRLWGN